MNSQRAVARRGSIDLLGAGQTIVRAAETVKSRILKKLAVRSNVFVDSTLHVGPGSVIWAPSKLVVGRNVYVGKHVTIEVDGVIGDEVLFANGCGVVGKSDHDIHDIGSGIRSAGWVGNNSGLSEPVLIGSDVWVGFNAVVQSGVVIGDSCIIAAGSVVTRSIPSNSIVGGVPAVALRHRFDESEFQLHWIELRRQGVRRMVDDRPFFSHTDSGGVPS